MEYALAGSFLDELPARLIGDKAYDSDPLDRMLQDEYGIEMIAPNRRNRSRSQDGRQLRRYRRRWKVERLFAWMHSFRRLVTRWEYHVENFLGFVHLACPACTCCSGIYQGQFQNPGSTFRPQDRKALLIPAELPPSTIRPSSSK